MCTEQIREEPSLESSLKVYLLSFQEILASAHVLMRKDENGLLDDRYTAFTIATSQLLLYTSILAEQVFLSAKQVFQAYCGSSLSS